MQTIVIIVVAVIAISIGIGWYKAWHKPIGKSNGSVNMPEPNDNNQGEVDH